MAMTYLLLALALAGCATRRDIYGPLNPPVDMYEATEVQFLPWHQPMQFIAYRDKDGHVEVQPMSGGSNTSSLMSSIAGPVGELAKQVMIMPVIP